MSPGARGRSVILREVHVATTRGRAWRQLMETYRDLVRWLEQEFRERMDIELRYYDVLLHVSEGEDGRRMTDLADVVVMSKSGLTSLVDRMEDDGLLARRPDPDDRRVTRIVLTEPGENTFAEAASVHAEMIRDVFTSRVTEEQAGVMLEVLERIREGMAE